MKAVISRDLQVASSLPVRAMARWPTWAAAMVWALVAWSATYWGWRWWGMAAPEALPWVPDAPVAVDSSAVARALAGRPTGGAPASAVDAPASGPHVLLGVLSDAQGHGVALIASEGQTAKPYRVGAALPDGWVLQAVGPREAWLQPPQGVAAGKRHLSLPTPAADGGEGVVMSVLPPN